MNDSLSVSYFFGMGCIYNVPSTILTQNIALLLLREKTRVELCSPRKELLWDSRWPFLWDTAEGFCSPAAHVTAEIRV